MLFSGKRDGKPPGRCRRAVLILVRHAFRYKGTSSAAHVARFAEMFAVIQKLYTTNYTDQSDFDGQDSGHTFGGDVRLFF